MAHHRIRFSELTRVLILEEHEREVFRIQCCNLCHFYCALFALKQYLLGNQGDSSSLKGIRYASR